MKRGKDKPIKILGAGISGLTAAINLAKAGYKVEVYEKTSETGTRFHQDLQGIENWSEDIDSLKEIKNMNLQLNFHYKPFKHVLYKLDDEKHNVNYKKPFFYLVQRGPKGDTLDQGLKKQALKLKVQIFYNKTIPEEKADIIATGPFKSNFKAFAKGITFETNFKDIAVGVIDKKTSQREYAYLLVDNDYGVICSISEMRPKDYDKLVNNTIKYFKKKYGLKIKDIKPMGGYETIHGKRRTLLQRTVLCDDSSSI